MTFYLPEGTVIFAPTLLRAGGKNADPVPWFPGRVVVKIQLSFTPRGMRISLWNNP